MSIAGVIAAVVRQDAPYQAEIAMGAQLICDFAGSRSGGRPYYWYRGTRYTRPEKIPGWSFSRATPGYAEDRAGNLIQFPANEPRITDKGLLLEEARTNSIRNSVATNGAVPGSPGTAPNNWSVFASGLGLSSSIVGTGTDAVLGLPYVDVRLFGTASGSQDCQILFEGTTSVAASNGQAWALSAYVGIVGGSTAGIGDLRLGADQYNAGAYLGSVASTVISPSSQLSRFAKLFTTTNAATTHVRPFLSLARSGAGVAIDVTLRLAAPGLELGGSTSSPIVTSGSVVTRAADLATINGQAVILGQFRTNFIPNSGMVGAAVGSLPSGGWSTSVGNGVTGSVVGVGTTPQGYPYIDVRVQGTPIASNNFGIYTSAGNVIVAASGQVWAASVLGAVIAGSAPGGLKLSLWEADSAGNYLTESSTAIAGGTLTPYSIPRTFNQPGTTYARSVIVTPLTAGVPVDFTIRLAAPQVERNNATDPIITTGTAAAAGNPVTLVAWADMPAADGVTRPLVQIDDSTASNRVLMQRDSSNQATAFLNPGGSTATIKTGLTAARVLKMAGRVRPSSFAGVADGGAVISSAYTPPALSVLRPGTTSTGSAYLNGYIQSVMVLGDTTDAQLQRLAA